MGAMCTDSGRGCVTGGRAAGRRFDDWGIMAWGGEAAEQAEHAIRATVFDGSAPSSAALADLAQQASIRVVIETLVLEQLEPVFSPASASRSAVEHGKLTITAV